MVNDVTLVIINLGGIGREDSDGEFEGEEMPRALVAPKFPF